MPPKKSFSKKTPADKKPMRTPKEKTIFDNAWRDPDKEKRRKEQDEFLGERKEIIFSKSLDDDYNPKYGAMPHSEKKEYTPKEQKKYQERFPKRSEGNNYSKREDNSKFSKKEKDSKYSKEKSFRDKPYGKQSSEGDSFNKENRNNRGKSFEEKPLKENRKERTASFDDKPFKKDRPHAKGFDEARGGKGKEKPQQSRTKNQWEQENKSKFDKFKKKENKNNEAGDFRKENIEERKFKSRFTPFADENKVYTSRLNGKQQDKFEGKDKKLEKTLKADYNPDAKLPLNKFIARCGVCSRRDAVELIKSGKITVNKEVLTEPGYKVQEQDVVRMDGKIIRMQIGFVYVLLNKPKGYITTLDDPKGRRIVSDLYEEEIKERIFPVGRLDRNTTGLLLLTNDGDLANQLAHPKYRIKKIYQVKLNKAVSKDHLNQIINGLELEDGIADVDAVSYLESKDEIGIEIHSGKNRIVRRIFEHLGYEVEKLDRVLYAGLTKKNLPKGKWRLLTKQEIINLKHLNKK